MAKCSYMILGLVSVVMVLQRSEGVTFTVGGPKGWTVPSDNSNVFYNQWAEKMRFQIGDSLLFVYQTSDSVLQVTKEDYTNCNTNTPIAHFSNGHTEFKFNQSGPFYFISGKKDNCIKNEKLVVIVLADRTTKSATSTPSPVAPAPAPVIETATPPAPTTTTTAAATPAPTTEGTTPPPSGASNVVMSLGYVGALLGCSIILG